MSGESGGEGGEGNDEPEISMIELDHAAPVQGVAVSRNGQPMILTGTNQGQLSLWKTGGGTANRRVTTLSTHGGHCVEAVALSAEGRWTASASKQDGFCLVHKVEEEGALASTTLRQVASLPLPHIHTQQITQLHLSIRELQTTPTEEPRPPDPEPQQPPALLRVAVGSLFAPMQVWNVHVATGETALVLTLPCLSTLEPTVPDPMAETDNQTLYCNALTADGRYAVFGNQARVLQVWDLSATTELERDIHAPCELVCSHEGTIAQLYSQIVSGVMAAAVTPDGSLAVLDVAHDYGGQLLLVDLITGQVVAAEGGFYEATVMTALEITPDFRQTIYVQQDLFEEEEELGFRTLRLGTWKLGGGDAENSDNDVNAGLVSLPNVGHLGQDDRCVVTLSLQSGMVVSSACSPVVKVWNIAHFLSSQSQPA